MQRICIIGGGYVGLTYAAGLALKGFHVDIVDIRDPACDAINRGECPIDEPGLHEAIKNSVDGGMIAASPSIDDVFAGCTLFLVCVGTYCDEAGNIDLSQVRAVATGLQRCLAASTGGTFRTVCVKSTVICGTTDGVVQPLLEASGKLAGKDFGLAMSPEFLKEGSALDDIMNPDKIVIGGIDQRSIDAVRSVLGCFAAGTDRDGIVIETDLRTAELIKYAQNAFLATKISFVNEISRFAEMFGVNVGEVARAMGMDARISPLFLNAGPGFGGSCFPKDVRALLTAGRKAGHDSMLLDAVLAVNEAQKAHVVELLAARRAIAGMSIAILGLSFKANTGDTRESVSRTVIPELVRAGAARVKVHDPSCLARQEISEDLGSQGPVEVHDDVHACIAGTDACLVLTEWPAYKGLGAGAFSAMAPGAIVVDARRILDKASFAWSPIELVVLGESHDRSFRPG